MKRQLSTHALHYVFTGASVMKVIATDADEPGNENSQIAYSIITQNPPDDMFYMDRNGTIFVKKPTLDREVQNDVKCSAMFPVFFTVKLLILKCISESLAVFTLDTRSVYSDSERSRSQWQTRW